MIGDIQGDRCLAPVLDGGPLSSNDDDGSGISWSGNGDLCILRTDAWYTCVVHITDDDDGDGALLYRITVASHHWW